MKASRKKARKNGQARLVRRKKTAYQTDIVEPSQRLIKLLEDLERKQASSRKSA